MVHHHHSEEVDTAALSTKAAVYAALILQDADAEITPDKINAIVDAAGIEEFEPIYSKLMAKGKDIASLLFAVGGAPASGPAPAASGAPAAAEAAPAAAEEKKGGKKEEKKKQEEEEEEEGDMGFGLFD